MALTTTRPVLRANVRRFCDIGGTNAGARHPDSDLDEYIDLAMGSLHRLLSTALPDLRLLSSTTVTMVDGTASYALPADFDHLISVDLVANGVKSWLLGYEMHERPALTSASAPSEGIPFTYRLRAANIEYLPIPTAAYTSTLWYIPAAAQFTSEAQVFDTISRLDEYLIAHASRRVAIKDKNGELASLAKQQVDELTADVLVAARSRDKNNASRIVDDSMANRWGRRPRWAR